ncbi:MAG: LacI family transcriptional regulator [Candidatus Nanopelagicales bacterium]|nr:LacI family transcriptional regulator [Candidatus Nanopelagicales bacterium]
MVDAPRTPAPTIYDVAKVAGVAPSTVSRAFARPGRVNADTAARIRAVAEQLGYRANPIARALSTSKTRMIGLMVSDVANPFYAELIRGAQMAASEEDYVVVLADAQESGALEREALERLLPVVEGIVIGSSRMSELALRSIAKQVPLIVLNHALGDIPSVVTDNRAGARAAVAHLRDLGHTSITYVAGPEASWTDGARWRALHDTARELGLQTRRVGPVVPTFEGGLGIGDEVLADGATAVVGYNDLVAIGIMAAARRARMRLPQDLSVIGFDDILTARLTTPPLTTVAAPIRFMGATAVRNLLAVLHGAKPRAGQAYVLPVKLVVRGSTAQRNRNRTSPALGTTSVSGSAS